MNNDDSRKDAEGQTEAQHQHEEGEPTRLSKLKACWLRIPLSLFQWESRMEKVRGEDGGRAFNALVLIGTLRDIVMEFRLFYEVEQEVIRQIVEAWKMVACWDRSIGMVQKAGNNAEGLVQNRQKVIAKLEPLLARLAHYISAPREVEVYKREKDDSTSYRVIIGRAGLDRESKASQIPTLRINAGSFDPKGILPKSDRSEFIREECSRSDDRDDSWIRSIHCYDDRRVVVLGVATEAHPASATVVQMEYEREQWLGMYSFELEMAGDREKAKVIVTTPTTVHPPEHIPMAALETPLSPEHRHEVKPQVKEYKVVHQTGNCKLGNRLELPAGVKTERRGHHDQREERPYGRNDNRRDHQGHRGKEQKCEAQGCGKQFLPKKPFHRFCDACAEKRNDQPNQPTDDQPTAPIVETREVARPEGAAGTPANEEGGKR